MGTEIRIEHRYPDALCFVREHGAEALVILHDLLANADLHDDELVVQASTRQIAEHLEFLSKDTVHRRLRQLRRARVIRTLATTTTSVFQPPTYVVDLTGTGIAVTRT
jgi:SOS-response transcriptional repressor LexA